METKYILKLNQKILVNQKSKNEPLKKSIQNLSKKLALKFFEELKMKKKLNEISFFAKLNI